MAEAMAVPVMVVAEWAVVVRAAGVMAVVTWVGVPVAVGTVGGGR